MRPAPSPEEQKGPANGHEEGADHGQQDHEVTPVQDPGADGDTDHDPREEGRHPPPGDARPARAHDPGLGGKVDEQEQDHHVPYLGQEEHQPAHRDHACPEAEEHVDGLGSGQHQAGRGELEARGEHGVHASSLPAPPPAECAHPGACSCRVWTAGRREVSGALC